MLIADIPYSFQVKKLMLSGGISLAYTDVGEGMPLLFIHGLGSAMPAWQKNIPFLSSYFRCLALDLPGYGKSTKEGFKASMAFYARVVAEFLERRQIASCYLVGHSMGGQVAMHTALDFPQKVKKLALLAPAGLETFSESEADLLNGWFEAEKVFRAGPETIEQQVKANFHAFPADARRILQDRIRYKSCDDYFRFCQIISDSVMAMLQEPVYEKLDALSVPAFILFGLQDGYIPSPVLHPELELENLLEKACSRMSQASYFLIDGCSHFVQWEQAEQVNKFLLHFFAKP